MAKLRIEIEMDNEAFADAPMREAGRILFKLSERLQFGIVHDERIKLYDINGNAVGFAEH